jgi:hypothetical protein
MLRNISTTITTMSFFPHESKVIISGNITFFKDVYCRINDPCPGCIANPNYIPELEKMRITQKKWKRVTTPIQGKDITVTTNGISTFYPAQMTMMEYSILIGPEDPPLTQIEEAEIDSEIDYLIGLKVTSALLS